MRSDAELVNAVLSGRQKAFAMLVERHERTVRARGNQLLRPDELTDIGGVLREPPANGRTVADDGSQGGFPKVMTLMAAGGKITTDAGDSVGALEGAKVAGSFLL